MMLARNCGDAGVHLKPFRVSAVCAASLHDFWPVGGAIACGEDPNCGSAPFHNEVSTNVIVNATSVFMYPPSAPFNNSNFNVTNNLVTQVRRCL